LVLLHAYHVPYEATYLPAPLLPDAISEADARVKRMIEESAAKLRKIGIRVDTITYEGDPPAAILDHAESVGADLIAMGTEGLSGLNRLLLGSTAERVVASAPCPVLTVRREAP
jgi:nucleotide-binding universal stress UspA family protein